jgi:hypothetical protein
MKHGFTSAVLLVIALGATLPATVRTPPQTAVESRLTLPERSGPPGAPVTIPLTLSTPESVSVGSIELKLTYPKPLLSFTKIEPSGLALGLEATVLAAVDDGRDGKSSTLRVTISGPPAEDGGKKPLPTGVLAYVGFTIAKTAKTETTISLIQTVNAMAPGAEPRPVTPFGVSDGKIKVTTKPVPACFFYMH